jgi:hypothetical protein
MAMALHSEGSMCKEPKRVIPTSAAFSVILGLLSVTADLFISWNDGPSMVPHCLMLFRKKEIHRLSPYYRRQFTASHNYCNWYYYEHETHECFSMELSSVFIYFHQYSSSLIEILHIPHTFVQF